MQNGQEYNPYKIFVGIFIPNLVLQDQKLSLGAKVIFGVLCQFAGKEGLCYPRQETIANRLGVSKRQVINYLNELKKEKYIKATRQGQGKTNVYSFLWKKTWTDPALLEVKDLSHQDVIDFSPHKELNRFTLNRDPSISPLKGGAPRKSYLRKEKRVGGKANLKFEDLNPKEREEFKKIDDEWKKVIKPRILKEQIKKEEKDLNFEELAKLEQTRLNFIGEKIKEIRRGQCL